MVDQAVFMIRLSAAWTEMHDLLVTRNIGFLAKACSFQFSGGQNALLDGIVLVSPVEGLAVNRLLINIIFAVFDNVCESLLENM